MSRKDGLPCKKCGTSDWNENSNCKQCARNRATRWQRANPEKRNEHSRRWKEANPEKVREYDREWGAANPEKKREKDRRWKAENPEKVRAKKHRYRTQKTEAGGSYTASEWKALVKHQGGRCLACGKKTKLTADHVIPVVAGGTSDISNIQGLCGPCNSSKGIKTTDHRTKPGIKRWIQDRLL